VRHHMDYGPHSQHPRPSTSVRRVEPESCGTSDFAVANITVVVKVLPARLDGSRGAPRVTRSSAPGSAYRS
jgi:hypothetical protein